MAALVLAIFFAQLIAIVGPVFKDGASGRFCSADESGGSPAGASACHIAMMEIFEYVNIKRETQVPSGTSRLLAGPLPPVQMRDAPEAMPP